MTIQAPIPTPLDALIAARATSEGCWLVPIEMVLFCTTSAFKAAILARYPGGHSPKRVAKVFARGKRFFAVVSFHGRPQGDLLLPLDVHTLEHRT
jgi:hypothetical protein